MDTNRCPNCENDLTESVNVAIIARVNAGSTGAAAITCPHCGEELHVDVIFSTAVTRRQEAMVG